MWNEQVRQVPLFKAKNLKCINWNEEVSQVPHYMSKNLSFYNWNKRWITSMDHGQKSRILDFYTKLKNIFYHYNEILSFRSLKDEWNIDWLKYEWFKCYE